MRTMGRRGMVASPHYLATEAGLNVLQRGGNAIDAAIAANAVLAVVTPYMCGLGGDLFAIVYRAEDGTIQGLNGSGRAPAEATVERVRQLAGGDVMPVRGPLTITVPGCVEAWGALHRRYGRLSFDAILADAITYAGDGFPATLNFSRAMRASAPIFHPETPAAETYLSGGEPPREGETFRQPRLAKTLRAIAVEGPAVYYRGWIAEELVRSIRAVGGLISEDDLARHHSDWVEPLSVGYRDLTVYELPPNSQGIIALMILAMLDKLPREEIGASGAGYIHLLSEAARLAYADRDRYLTDPEHMNIDPRVLLSDEYAGRRAALINHRVRGAPVAAGSPGDTIYLCTADGEGNLVSLIESNYAGFGSGVMGGETGIMLQNRGAWFSLREGHANVIAPGKRTMHTLMPGMAFRGRKPWLVFGTMGGSMQPQIHVEILTRLLDQGLPPDEALAAPRFDAVPMPGEGGPVTIQLEDRFPHQVIDELRARGHDVQLLEPFTSAMGHSHLIRVLDDGTYVGAADPRHDSLALGY